MEDYELGIPGYVDSHLLCLSPCYACFTMYLKRALHQGSSNRCNDTVYITTQISSFLVLSFSPNGILCVLASFHHLLLWPGTANTAVLWRSRRDPALETSYDNPGPKNRKWHFRTTATGVMKEGPGFPQRDNGPSSTRKLPCQIHARPSLLSLATIHAQRDASSNLRLPSSIGRFSGGSSMDWEP